jgi:hypothetical protein
MNRHSGHAQRRSGRQLRHISWSLDPGIRQDDD